MAERGESQVLEADPERMSYFDEHYAQRMAYSASMPRSGARSSPGRETLDYLPTQVIAEYLRSRAEPGIDGIVFHSAQITDSANNVVLFPNAASVKDADQETERRIRFHHRPARSDEDADEEDQQDRDWIIFEPQVGDDVEGQQMTRTTTEQCSTARVSAARWGRFDLHGGGPSKVQRVFSAFRTPLVHPNPIWLGYSPPAAVRYVSMSYFSNNAPVAA